MIVMAQATFSIRMDEETKQGMDVLCVSLGISMSAAFNVFARAFVRGGGFPFDVRLGRADIDSWNAFLEAGSILRKKFPEEPSLDEIEEEIKSVRSKK